MFFSTWKEIYSTWEMGEFYTIKQLLYENNIQLKTDILDNNVRISQNPVRGDGILSRFGNTKNLYRIFVKEVDYNRAMDILSRRRG